MRENMGGRKDCYGVVVLWATVMLSNNLVLPVISTPSTSSSFGDDKNYYASPSTPSGFHSNPSHRGSSSHHGSSGTGQSNCVPPTPSGGSGGHYYPTPKPPSHGGGCRCPSPPSTGGGGGSGGGYYGPPTPTTPIVPSPPLVSSPPLVPSPPLFPVTPTPLDPNLPPFPCTYWGTHPTLIFGVLGWWATVGGLFGVTTLPGLNAADYSVQKILTSTRRDGYSSLYREATASLLNSMATKHFPFTPNQVKSSFLTSLSSDKAASAQARLFRLANEGRLKHLVSTTTTNTNDNP